MKSIGDPVKSIGDPENHLQPCKEDTVVLLLPVSLLNLDSVPYGRPCGRPWPTYGPDEITPNGPIAVEERRLAAILHALTGHIT